MEEWLLMTMGEKIATVGILLMGVVGLLAVIGIFIYFLIKNKIKKIGKDGIEFNTDKGEYYLEEQIGNNINSSIEEQNLLKHRFFSLMDMVKMDGYLMPDAIDSDKTRINLTFLKKCFFPTFNTRIKEFMIKMTETKGETLYMLPSYLIKLIEEYSKKAEDIKIDLLDGIVIYGVPDCYINKFKYWQAERFNVLLESISDIIVSSFYNTWYLKCVACLDYLHFSSSLTIYDADRTLNQLNGNLEAEIEEKRKGGVKRYE